MATISITIPTQHLNRVIDAISANYKYQVQVSDGEGGTIPNPETKAQFAKRMMARWVKDNVKGYEASRDAEVARATAINDAEGIDIT